MIYLDNSATTKLDEEAGRVFLDYACNDFFNPSAIYDKGAYAHSCIVSAKEVVAKALGTDFSDNIIFTGSATEANNLAIMGAYRKNFGKMIFSYAEHPSVFNVAERLKLMGIDVQFVNLQPTGEIDYEDLKAKLDPSVSFISIMHICNENGAINDLKKIANIKNGICPKAIFHSDGVQAFGKVKINVDYFGVDLYTVSGHKCFGPKGIGALYVRNKNILIPIIYGGGQEYNLRSGTENVPCIMAFKKAIENFGSIKQNYDYVAGIKDAFLSEIESDGVKINSYHSPYVLSLSFDGVNGETLVHMMEQNEIYISRGSACSSKKAGNRILENMGLSSNQILGSIRVSFSKHTTKDEAKFAGKTLNECYKTLKQKLSGK